MKPISKYLNPMTKLKIIVQIILNSSIGIYITFKLIKQLLILFKYNFIQILSNEVNQVLSIILLIFIMLIIVMSIILNFRILKINDIDNQFQNYHNLKIFLIFNSLLGITLIIFGLLILKIELPYLINITRNKLWGISISYSIIYCIRYFISIVFPITYGLWIVIDKIPIWKMIKK